jgi:hypothetical protein
MGLVAEEMRNSKFRRVLVGLDFRPLCNESSNGRALLKDLVSIEQSEEEGAKLHWDQCSLIKFQGENKQGDVDSTRCKEGDR